MRLEGPLSGLKLIELAGIGAAPHAAMMLSDMGAEVVCVDRVIPSGLGVSLDPKFDLVRRGRRSVAIDLKASEGRETVLRLIEQSDGVFESFRPGVMERLGLGPDVCLHRNPRIVYGRLTGWGQTGALADRAGHDINYIALSGVLAAIGPSSGGPLPPLNLVGDIGGAAYFAFGMVCGLLSASRTGQGQVVDGAMLDAAASMLTMIVGFHRGGIWSEERGSNIIDGGAPFYRTYRTSDGTFVAVGAVEPKFYKVLLEKLQLASDADMYPQMDRSKWPLQTEKLAKAFESRTQREWSDLLEAEDACCAPVLSLNETLDHPHVRDRGVYSSYFGVTQPAPAPRFSRTTLQAPSEPRRPGQDSCSILGDFGFDPAEIDRLIALGAVVQNE